MASRVGELWIVGRPLLHEARAVLAVKIKTS
jgi:hypothetical protein